MPVAEYRGCYIYDRRGSSEAAQGKRNVSKRGRDVDEGVDIDRDLVQ
jgi:hypothetical protein